MIYVEICISFTWRSVFPTLVGLSPGRSAP